jgi:hypothetical protein
LREVRLIGLDVRQLFHVLTRTRDVDRLCPCTTTTAAILGQWLDASVRKTQVGFFIGVVESSGWIGVIATVVGIA